MKKGGARRPAEPQRKKQLERNDEMTKRLMMLAMLAVALGARAETETVGDYTRTYQISGDTAEIVA